MLNIEQWQWLYNQTMRIHTKVGDHPTRNEVRNWLLEVMDKENLTVDDDNCIIVSR